MTDKLKELVAKHVKTVREFVEHSQDSGDPGGGCQRCWDLFERVTKETDELSALLAEQAPAGELLSDDALEELLLRAYKDCKHDVYHVCTECVHEEFDKLRKAAQAPAGEWDSRAWLRKAFPDVREGFFNEIQDIIEAAYATGRSSQPAERREGSSK